MKSSPKQRGGARRGAGRKPAAGLNLERIRAAGKLGATIEDLAFACGISKRAVLDAFERHPEYRVEFDRAQAEMRLSLRRRLIQKSRTSVPALIHATKTLCGLTDKIVVQPALGTHYAPDLTEAEREVLNKVRRS